MARDETPADHEDSHAAAPPDRDASTTATAPATVAATKSAERADPDALPNALTIIGRGTPSSFELTVDGEIELADEGSADVTVRSGTAVEGTIETGTVTVRFAGDLTDVTFVDRGITGSEPAITPNVHVDYGTPEPSRS